MRPAIRWRIALTLVPNQLPPEVGEIPVEFLEHHTVGAEAEPALLAPIGRSIPVGNRFI